MKTVKIGDRVVGDESERSMLTLEGDSTSNRNQDLE